MSIVKVHIARSGVLAPSNTRRIAIANLLHGAVEIRFAAEHGNPIDTSLYNRREFRRLPRIKHAELRNACRYLRAAFRVEFKPYFIRRDFIERRYIPSIGINAQSLGIGHIDELPILVV